MRPVRPHVLDDVPPERYREAFEHTPLAALLLDGDGRLLRANAPACRLLGRDEGDLAGRRVRELVPPGDAEDAWRLPERALEGPVGVELERRLLRADGSVLWALVHLVLFPDRRGRVAHAFAHLQDVTERRRLERDAVTGLPSLAHLEAATADHVLACRRYGAVGALLVVELDGFRGLVARLGHAAGDRVLHATAQALCRRLRMTDALARAVGGEFRVLLPRATGAEALVVARDLRDALRAERCAVEEGVTVVLSCSVGVAPVRDPDDGGDLVRRARAALAEGPARREGDIATVLPG